MRSHLRSNPHIRISLQRTTLLLVVGCILFSISSNVDVNAAPIDKSTQSIPQRTTSAEKTGLLNVISLADVPDLILRRADEFLEELRGSEIAPNWEIARFSDDPRVLYRPDVEGPAYYELPVEALNGEGTFEPVGFIQLSTGPHDHPITHWNLEGLSPTQELDSLAADAGGINNVYFKLDALSYASEYEGPVVLNDPVDLPGLLTLNGLPPRIDGLQALPLNTEFEISTTVFSATQETTDDSQIITDTNIAPISQPETNGPQNNEAVTQEEWSSWDELKEGYGQSYGTMLAFLGDEAAPQWRVENEVKALLLGETRTIRALPGRTLEQIELRGPGADIFFIQREDLPAGDLNTGVRLTVLNIPEEPQTSLPFSVTLQYEGGTSEIQTFALVNEQQIEDPQSSIFLPYISAGPSDGNEARVAATNDASAVVAAQTVRRAASAEINALTNRWSSWRYWWAGNDANQRLYRPLARGEAPNTSTCDSGSGATAWAMLLGWADLQASSNNPAWSGRWGIYRQGGGYGGDAVAPTTMDNGVRNMTWDLRNQTGTQCNTGYATWPWQMNWAAEYLRGRSGATVSTHYNAWGVSQNSLRDRAINSIKNGNPVIIGKGLINHYSLAYGYAQRTRPYLVCNSLNTLLCYYLYEYQQFFKVNHGRGGAGSLGWVNADTWFVGELRPGTTRDTPIDNLSILTHNVWLIKPPFGISAAPNRSGRAALIAEASYIRGHDIVVLNELFDNSASDIILNGLRSEYPYQTPVAGRGYSGWDQTLGEYRPLSRLEAGVAVISKWPIEERQQYLFDDGPEQCGTDAWSNKGFVYTKINYQMAQKIHIIATHAQSADNGCDKKTFELERGAQERTAEFQAIRRFLLNKGIPRDEYVFIVGDLNVIKGTGEYTNMLNTLNVAAPSYTGHYATYDPHNNALLGRGARSEFLDYLLVSRDFKEPTSWYNHGLQPSEEYADHYPVNGTVSSQGSAPTNLPTYYEITIRTGSNCFIQCAGTDDNVFLRLIGANGQSEELLSNGKIAGNAYEANQTDRVYMEGFELGDLRSIQIRKTQYGLGVGGDWYIESISVRNRSTGVTKSWSGGYDMENETKVFTLN